jgi:hypothetical protein
MVALFVTLDILEISKLKLNFNEYLTLVKLQHDLDGKSFPFVPDDRFFDRLLNDEFIIKKEDGTGFTLGPAGLKVFNPENDLFEEFYKTFPHKVPTNTGFRPVSTNDPDGMSARVTHVIWNKVTKGKPYLQEKIINNLKKELTHRQAEGSLGFLQNIDTWLRQATWEKWDDIPDKRSSTKYTRL